MTKSLKLAALALLAALSANTAAKAQQFTIKVSSPTVNDVTHEWMKAFKAGVEGRSNGRLKVEIYPANQLGQIPATVEGVALGTIEVTAPATGFLVGLEPRFQLFDAPGLFDSMTHARKVLSDPGIRDRLASFGSRKGVEILAIYPHGPLMLLSHKPVRTVVNFQGQKIRVPGAAPLHLEPFRKLGASPISMPLGEVLPALQNKAIDGLIGGAPIFPTFKYYDVAKALTELPSSFLVVAAVSNRDFLKSLGPELEQIVREEARKAEEFAAEWGVQDMEQVYGTWRKNGGEIIVLSASEKKSYLNRVTPVLPPILSANPAIKEDYEAILAAAGKHRQ
jgi:TRAP-type C4-dicarboxylate transport system substrate-binding protein